MAVDIYYAIPITIVGGVTLIICIVLILKIILEFRRRAKEHDDRDPILPFFKYCTLITMAAFTFSTLTLFLMNVVYLVNIRFYMNDFYTITSAIFILFFVVAKLSLYALLIQRLRVTFLDSIYALNRKSFIVLFIIIIVGIFGFCLMYHQRLAGLMIGVMCDIILCCSILYLFIQRLFSLTLNYHISNSKRSRNKCKKKNKPKKHRNGHNKHRPYDRYGYGYGYGYGCGHGYSHSHNGTSRRITPIKELIIPSKSNDISSSHRKFSGESDASELNDACATPDAEKLPMSSTKLQKLRINSVSNTFGSCESDDSAKSPKPHKKKSSYDNHKYKNPKFCDKHNDDLQLDENDEYCTNIDADGYHIATSPTPPTPNFADSMSISTPTQTRTQTQSGLGMGMGVEGIKRFRHSVCRTLTNSKYVPSSYCATTRHKEYGTGRTAKKYCLDDIELHTVQMERESNSAKFKPKDIILDQEALEMLMQLKLTTTTSRSSASLQQTARSTPVTPRNATINENQPQINNEDVIDGNECQHDQHVKNGDTQDIFAYIVQAEDEREREHEDENTNDDDQTNEPQITRLSTKEILDEQTDTNPKGEFGLKIINETGSNDKVVINVPTSHNSNCNNQSCEIDKMDENDEENENENENVFKIIPETEEEEEEIEFFDGMYIAISLYFV